MAVGLLWAGIFLPGLGSPEIKGEEGRRIMPAVAMIEGNGWIVPQVGGEPFLRKPPLLNWLIAGSFNITGVRNEWTARLPSALSVLALVIVMVGVGGIWLGYGTALVAAVLAMTNLGLLEKARLAEIEALYVALTGIALVCWLVASREKWSPWLIWIIPYFFLGLAMLTKGPPALIFFYGMVLVVLWRERTLRQFFSIAHLAGFCLMMGIFLWWAVPYLRLCPEAWNVWVRQSAGRVTENAFDLQGWLLALPRGVSNYLPWVMALPILWREKNLARLDPRDGELIRALRWPVVILFFGLLLIPGVLPRYTLPMLVPASLLLALALNGMPRDWPRMASRVGVGVAVGAMIYAVAIIPLIRRRDDVRPIGLAINCFVPREAVLHVCDVRYVKTFAAYHPALFYVEARCEYEQRLSELPVEARYLFTRAESVKKLQKLGLELRTLAEFKRPGASALLLLELGGASSTP